MNALRRFWSDFFNAVSSPVNLAVFRLVLFWMHVGGTSWNKAVFWSSLPAELRFPPTGVAPFLRYIPIDPHVAGAVSVVFDVACFLAFIGFRTRLAAGVAALAGIYIMGLPNMFGKINHAHHQIWFMALMAFSRCGDVLSVDALLRAFRRADKGDVAPPVPARDYALPLRFVWLLMGVIYFWPGFWKLNSAGLAWALSDNPKIMLYNKWAELGGWLPAFRIDHYPILYQLGGLGTMAFEVSFLFLMFHPLTRALAVLWGLLFHVSVFFTMNIEFWGLLVFYVAFVDWAALFRWGGRRLFPVERVVLFDGNCGICRRTIAALRTLDVLERLRWVNALDEAALVAAGAGAIDRDALLHDMHVIGGNSVLKGYDGYRAIAWRIPLLWPLAPFLYLPPVAAVGRAIYRRVADHRACALPVRGTPAVAVPSSGRLGPVWAMGVTLLVLTNAAGATNLNSWPFARYPTFAGMFKPQMSLIVMIATTPDGRDIDIAPLSVHSRIPPERLVGMMRRILEVKDPSDRARRLAAFWSFASREMALPPVARVRVYRDTFNTTPGSKESARNLLYEFAP